MTRELVKVDLARGRVLLGLILTLTFVTGCATDNYPVIRVVNHSSEAVDVVMVPVGGTDGSVILKDLKPGTETSYSQIAGGCSAVQLLARDSRGLVIARSPVPICNPSTWLIEPTDPS